MADIELVIKISEKTLKDIKMLSDYGYNSMFNGLVEAISNGTPLPKGHGRLIDADNTILKICGNSCGCHLEECGHDEHCFSVTRIESATTIIGADRWE